MYQIQFSPRGNLFVSYFLSFCFFFFFLVKRKQFVILHFYLHNQKRESGQVIVNYRNSGITIRHVTQGKQHNAIFPGIFVTQNIPLARIVCEAYNYKNQGASHVNASIGILLLLKHQPFYS